MILLSFQKFFLEFFTSTSILFSHTNLSYPLLYYHLGILVVRVIFDDQEKKITKCSTPLYLEFVKVRPPQASVLACVVLAGTSEGLTGPIVLKGAHCWCCDTE